MVKHLRDGGPVLVLAAAVLLAHADRWVPGLAVPWPGGAAVVPPFLLVVLMVLAATAWLCSRWVRHRPPWRKALLVGLGSTILASVALVVAGFSHASTTQVVLLPASASGCTVVARESAFLMAGAGEVWVLDRGWGVPCWVGSYVVDDGYAPAASGTYELTWSDAATGF